MKRKNLAKKLTAMLMTGAMVMSMGMTAFAEGNTPQLTVGEDNTIELKKYLQVESEYVLAPDADFTFTITSDDTVNSNGEPAFGSNSHIVYPGELGGIYFSTNDSGAKVYASTISFDPAKTYTYTTDETTRKTSINDKTTLTIDPAAFSKLGIFRYKIIETNPTADGVTKVTGEYYLDVYIVDNGNGKEVSNVIAFTDDTDTNTKASELAFTNEYATTDLTVKKVVTGNQGNKSETFQFSITVTSGHDAESEASPSEQYLVRVYRASTGDFETNTITLDTGVTNTTISLGNNDYFVIDGLSENDTYSIYEVVAGEDGYTTQYYDGITSADDEIETGEGTNLIGSVEAGGNANSVTVSQPTGGNAESRDILVDNNKNITTPTGIAMTFAPYIVMVAFAGVFAVMFLRKKREDF